MLHIEIRGTAVFSDLLAETVRDEYNALTGVGFSFEEAENTVIKGIYETDTFIPAHESVFWIALACTEHKYGALSERVKEKALNAIDSGEDLKKWENAAEYAPYHKYILQETDQNELSEKMLFEIARKKSGETPRDPVEESFHSFQCDMMNRLVKEYPNYKKLLPQRKSGKPKAPVPKPDGLPDEFFYQIDSIGGSCEKKLEMRRSILKQTKEYLLSSPKPKKPPKIRGRKCPWKAGDVVAVKTHSASLNKTALAAADIYSGKHGIRPVTCFYEDGKYILMLILKTVSEPVSDFIPVEVVSNDYAVVGFYDYYGDTVPDKEELENIPFYKRNASSVVHTAVHMGFYNSARFLKKTEWTVIEHFDGYPYNIPEFFTGGVMGSMAMNFDGDVFDFAGENFEKH